MRLLVLSISVALAGTWAYGQTPCQIAADAELKTCLAAAQKTFDDKKATDLASYNDCTDPFSTNPDTYGACRLAAYPKCGVPVGSTDNSACLSAEWGSCSTQYLGSGSDLGICKNAQLDEDTAAGAEQTRADTVCYTTWSNMINQVCNAKPPPSPIVIDPTGEGFWLTDKQHGVNFRQFPTGQLAQVSWTNPAHHNAWLVRPNSDGSVTSLAANMFGNLSPQPPSDERNGYAALAYWAAQEGCGDIKKLDPKTCPAVWTALRLWHDANQDGIAQPGEIQTLDAAGIDGISLNYHESKHVDQYGNLFRYVAGIEQDAASKENRCYDVFLVP